VNSSSIQFNLNWGWVAAARMWLSSLKRCPNLKFLDSI
jgi:hypothetical protein